MSQVKVVRYAGEVQQGYRTFEPTLPAAGIVTIPVLANVFHVSEKSLVEWLGTHNVPILKLSRRRSTWLVSLERLHGAVLDDE
jgi:hypothetical protein